MSLRSIERQVHRGLEALHTFEEDHPNIAGAVYLGIIAYGGYALGESAWDKVFYATITCGSILLGRTAMEISRMVGRPAAPPMIVYEYRADESG